MNIEKSELNHVELNYNIRFNGTGTTAHVKKSTKSAFHSSSFTY